MHDYTSIQMFGLLFVWYRCTWCNCVPGASYPVASRPICLRCVASTHRDRLQFESPGSKMFGLTCLILSSLFVVYASAQECPSPWVPNTLYPGFCYLHHEFLVNWNTANAICQIYEGGDLASIDEFEEGTAIYDYWKRTAMDQSLVSLFGGCFSFVILFIWFFFWDVSAFVAPIKSSFQYCRIKGIGAFQHFLLVHTDNYSG